MVAHFYVLHQQIGAAIYIVLTTGSGSDYNATYKITNCIFAPTAVFTNSSGTSAQEGWWCLYL